LPRPRIRFFAACSAIVCLSLAAQTSFADETRRIATLAPDGSLWMKQMRKGAAAIDEPTDGRIVTKFYAGGVQGDERDVVRKMKLGHLDGSALTSIGLGMIYPGIRVLQLPGFYGSVEEVDYVRKKMWPHFRKKFRAEGFELLTGGDVGWIYLFSTKSVKSQADFKKLKIWVWDGDPMGNTVFKKLGLKGVPLGVPEVLPALQTGKVEAAFSSPLAAVALQWHNKIRYIGGMPVGYGIGGMVMRTDIWKGASKADKKTQRKIGRKLSKKTIRRVRRDNKRALMAMKKGGAVVMKMPKDLQAEFDKQSKAMWKKWVGKLYSQDELDLVIKYRDEYRAKNPDAPIDGGILD
jgi:TRAP-type C4-dicarboxylate transport system substrate-binding protein